MQLESFFSIVNKSKLSDLFTQWRPRVNTLQYLINKNTILHEICAANKYWLIHNDLILAGVDINATDDEGSIALVYASANGYTECVKMLCKMKNIDVNVKGFMEYSPLSLAARFGHHECVQLLCQMKDIDVNTKSCFGETALIFAAHNGHYECVQILCSMKGIDIDAEAHGDKEGTALSLVSNLKSIFPYSKCYEILYKVKNEKVHDDIDVICA
jgi:ankyrin repeat protein